MAIEWSIPLSERIQLSILLADSEAVLATLIGVDNDRCRIAAFARNSRFMESSYDISIPEGLAIPKWEHDHESEVAYVGISKLNAKVSVLCMPIVQSGYILTVNAFGRNPPSKVLGIAVAIAAADIGHSNILDESLLLGGGRVREHAEVVAQLQAPKDLQQDKAIEYVLRHTKLRSE